MRTAFIILLLTTCFIACNKHKLHPVDYARYVSDEENGLRMKYAAKDVEYVVQYKPAEYIAASELRRENIDEIDMNQARSELEGLQYFSLSIVPGNTKTGVALFGKTENQEVNPRYDYWAYNMQYDIYLVEGQDTLYPALFHYEDTYGIKPSADWSIAFEKSDTGKVSTDKIFVIEDQILGSGPIKLKIAQEAINAVPSIITE